MTEHQHHGGHQGGHEIDAPPTRELFNIVWGLGALTLLSLITCVQLFNDQARDLAAERGKEGSPMLANYRKEMEARTTRGGTDELTDAAGKVVARYTYIPLASARDLILAKPEKLGAFPAPPGWVHPDDVAAGGQGAGHAAPPPPVAPVPAVPGEQPAGTVVDPNAPAVPSEPGPTPGAGEQPAGAPAGAEAQPAGAPAGAAPTDANPPAGANPPADAKADAPADQPAADAAPPPPVAPAPSH